MNFNDLLINCSYKNEMEDLLKITNLAYKNWQVYWSNFLPYFIYEELIEELSKLNDLSFFVYGGYENFSRAKIACYRNTILNEVDDLISAFPGKGIEITGNFIFDNATQNDFRNFLTRYGIKENSIGDIWTIGERGAQGIISEFKDENIQEKLFLRDVEVNLRIIDLKDLKTPIQRIERTINTVESSTRLDAIASAGFRLSRNKIVDRIKNGLLSINGKKVTKPIINVKQGDKINLENKGFIEILDISETKRGKFKIKLIKK